MISYVINRQIDIFPQVIAVMIAARQAAEIASEAAHEAMRERLSLRRRRVSRQALGFGRGEA